MTAPLAHAATRRGSVRPVQAPLRSVGWFVAGSLALTGVAVLGGAGFASTAPFLLALGPAMIALVLAWREGHGALRALLRTLWTRPSRRRWYLALGVPFGAALATVGAGVALGYGADPLFPDLFPAMVIVPLVVLLPGLAEELAWRGFATPRLATAMSPLAASLVLAVPWVVLHLALMVPGGVNASAAVWPAVLSVAAYAVVLTWVVVGSGGSVLLAGLVHAGFNGVVPLMRGIDADAAWAIRAVVAAAIAIAIVALGGFRGRTAEPLRRAPAATATTG